MNDRKSISRPQQNSSFASSVGGFGMGLVAAIHKFAVFIDTLTRYLIPHTALACFSTLLIFSIATLASLSMPAFLPFITGLAIFQFVLFNLYTFLEGYNHRIIWQERVKDGLTKYAKFIASPFVLIWSMILTVRTATMLGYHQANEKYDHLVSNHPNNSATPYHLMDFPSNSDVWLSIIYPLLSFSGHLQFIQSAVTTSDTWPSINSSESHSNSHSDVVSSLSSSDEHDIELSTPRRESVSSGVFFSETSEVKPDARSATEQDHSNLMRPEG